MKHKKKSHTSTGETLLLLRLCVCGGGVVASGALEFHLHLRLVSVCESGAPRAILTTIADQRQPRAAALILFNQSRRILLLFLNVVAQALQERLQITRLLKKTFHIKTEEDMRRNTKDAAKRDTDKHVEDVHTSATTQLEARPRREALVWE